MLKKILLAFASIFLVWQSYQLLLILPIMGAESWSLNLFIAFLINLFITGIFAFAGFAFPTHKLLPDTYYQIYDSKKLKKIFKFLRVELFRKFLLATFWRDKKQQKRYFNGTAAGLSHFSEQSKKSEFGHLLPFILINLVVIYCMLIGAWLLAFFTFLWNIFGNWYPILLQRHHRMRLQVLERRMKSRR